LNNKLNSADRFVITITYPGVYKIIRFFPLYILVPSLLVLHQQVCTFY